MSVVTRETELVKTHPRVPRGSRRLDDADLPQERIAFFRRDASWYRAQAEKLGPEVLAAGAELLEVGIRSRLRQAQRVLDLETTFGSTRLNAACTRARAFGDARYRTIKNILAAGLDQHPGQVPLPPPERATHVGAFLRGPEAFAATGRPESPATPAWTSTPETDRRTEGTAVAAAPDDTAPTMDEVPPAGDGQAERFPEALPVAPDGATTGRRPRNDRAVPGEHAHVVWHRMAPAPTQNRDLGRRRRTATRRGTATARGPPDRPSHRTGGLRGEKPGGVGCVWTASAAARPHAGRRCRGHAGAELGRPGLHAGDGQSAVGGRHRVYRHPRGMVAPGNGAGWLLFAYATFSPKVGCSIPASSR